jgi:hypothetical protein
MTREAGQARVSPLLNPRVFITVAVICVLCGLIIGAGLYMLVNAMMCKPGPSTSPFPFTTITTCERGIAVRFIPLLIAFGVIAGVLPHAPPVKRAIHAIVDDMKRKDEERQVRSYFERCP